MLDGVGWLLMGDGGPTGSQSFAAVVMEPPGYCVHNSGQVLVWSLHQTSVAVSIGIGCLGVGYADLLL